MAGHIVWATKGEIYDALVRGTAFNKGSNLWVGLSSTIPNEDGTEFTEPVGAGYGRIARVPTDWEAPSTDGTGVNATPIIFAAATAPWGSILCAGLFLTETGTESPYLFFNFPEAIFVDTGLAVQFPAGTFQFGPWALP